MTKVVPGSGAILTPYFNENYGVDYFVVEYGGTGYASTDPPKIEITGATPSVEGSFYPVIVDGSIVSIRVIDPGEGYIPNTGNFESASFVSEVNRRLSGNNIVGVSSFKLTSNGFPLFYRVFDPSNGIATSVNLSENSFTIPKHNFQTGQKIFYDYGDGSPIGIGTTNTVESDSVVDIIMEVGGAGGGSIYEDGYNVAISTSISGSSANPGPGISAKAFGVGNPIPSFSITGIGTGAKFEVYITYDNSDGSPLSTSIILKEGGGQYAVGDQIGIAGTFLDGTTPTNNLTFFISKVSSSRIAGQANQTYTNISGITSSGPGSGAIFTISRDSLGDISVIDVVNGGSGYALTSSIKINGTDVGGNDINDNLFVSPSVLGTSFLPRTLYVSKLNDNDFRVQGTPDSDALKFDSLGIGSHSFAFENPNASSLIVIDNIIQSPIYLRDISLKLSEPIGVGSTVIYLNYGLNDISSLDFLKVDDEYLKIESIGIGSTNAVQVNRGFFGSIATSHLSDADIDVVRGDYNIVNDSIYFSTPPYGEIGLEELKVSSTFQGKAFSRSFDLVNNPDDKNIIADDISVDFVGESEFIGIFTGTLDSESKGIVSGIHTSLFALGDVLNLEFDNNLFIKTNTKIVSIGDSTVSITPNHNVSVGIATTTFSVIRLSFVLKSNRENIVGLFSDTNGSGIDINNNPIVLVNNVSQDPEFDYTIDTIGNNTIKFISGVPNAGKIVNTSISTSFGYSPLVGASATVSISGFGTISEIFLDNTGSGYRVAPIISLGSTVGSGASFSANIGVGGTITSIDIINPGIGYTYTNKYFGDTGITEEVSVGSTTIFVNDTSFVSVGSSVTIVGVGITNARIVSYGNTFVNISSSSTISTTISSGLRVFYSTLELPEVIIPDPPQYSNTPLSYLSGTSGSGKNATASIVVGSSSSIISFKIDNSGYGYNKGDILVASGIVTNSTTNFSELTISVDETLTDKFSLFYPGQFIRVDDISQYFNGKRRKFTLTQTNFGIKTPLDLKVDPGVDLDLQNNIFVYINDILQEPNESYVYSGTRIIFTEPPKENSKCIIYYYRGSSLDVEEFIPPETIKQGDEVQIKETKEDPYDIDQFDRTVKKIISSSEFDTLPYNSIGINTTTDLVRPLRWEKQTRDLIINRVLYSKSRQLLKSRNYPSTKLIKDVSIIDTNIYVQNAFPLFSLDDYRGLVEDNRSAFIVENKEIEFPIFNSSVSVASTISDIEIVYGGNGFTDGSTPEITISSSFIEKRDPILNWTSAGIDTSQPLTDLNSVIFSNYYISIGNGGKYIISEDGINWNSYDTGFNKIFNDIVSFSGNYVGVGSDATIIKGVGIGITIPLWTQYEIIKRTNQFGFISDQSSNYDSHLNSVSYMPSTGTLVAVGNRSATIGYSPILSAVGIGSTQFVEKATTNPYDLKAVANNNQYFVVVGETGIIRYSSDADTWIIVGDFDKPPNIQDLNDIIWDGTQFIAVGDNGELIATSNPASWSRIDNDFYVILDDSGLLYFSFDLINWSQRSTLQANQLNDLVFEESIGDYGRYVAVGVNSTAIYSNPIINRATATSTVSGSSSITSIQITNDGFGYNFNSNPPVIAKTSSYNTEELQSIKVKGDFGTIINVNPVGTGVTWIEFTLKIESYDSNNYASYFNTPGIGYSSLNTFVDENGDLIQSPQLEKGDYFTITDSNVISDYPLVGITTFNGLVERVGILTSTDVPIIIQKGTINNSAITGIDTTGLEIGDKVKTYEVNYFNEGTEITSIGSSTLIVSSPLTITGINTFDVLFERDLITLDGVYTVEDITERDNNAGIVTVTCRFGLIPDAVDITNAITKYNQSDFYGRYSWGKIYGYQNRARGNPKQFSSYIENGIVGLSTAPDVYRTRPLI